MRWRPKKPYYSLQPPAPTFEDLYAAKYEEAAKELFQVFGKCMYDESDKNCLFTWLEGAFFCEDSLEFEEYSACWVIMAKNVQKRIARLWIRSCVGRRTKS